jgi:hypothetical protein
MSENMEPQVAAVNRIKLPFYFESQKLSAEFEALKAKCFEYYNVVQLRAPAHPVTTLFPISLLVLAAGYADGSWTDWFDTPASKQSPYFTQLVDTFRKHIKVTLVRLYSV